MNIKKNLKKKYVSPNLLKNNSYNDRKQIAQPSTNRAEPTHNNKLFQNQNQKCLIALNVHINWG